MDIQLHAGQIEIFKNDKKVRVAVMGRRFGKSRLVTYELLLAALQFPGKTNLASPERVLGALPTLTQARKILWQPLVNLCEQTEISKYVSAINRSEYRISFEGRKPDIVIAGSDDQGGAGLRGNRLYFAALDEFQSMRPGVFDAVIYPALADTPGSRAILTGTPMGVTNHLYEMFQRATLYPDVYAAFNMPTWTNPTIDPREIEMARKTLPPKLFTQEYNATFESNEFAIFTELDPEENRCNKLPDSFDRISFGIDFGDVKPAITVWGTLDNHHYYIDGWNPSDGQVVPQPYFDAKLVELASRWNPVGCFADPSRPASILSIRTLGKKHGLIGLQKTVAAYNKIADGNNQLHSLIFQRRILIPKEDITKGRKGHVNGDNFYNELANYHYEITKDGVVTEKVAPNQVDHLTDSSRYNFARKSGS